MNKYVSEETKKWQKREELLESLEPLVCIVSAGLTLIVLIGMM